MRALTLALLLMTALLVPAYAEDPGVEHLNQVKVADLTAAASGTIPLGQVAFTYAYQNQWGIADTWQVQGTTLTYWKAVHTAEFADMFRNSMATGNSLTPMQMSVFELEYGDYDKYYKRTLTETEVRAMLRALADTRVVEAPARVGCGQSHWGLDVAIQGRKTQLFDVNAPGNPIFAAAITALQNQLRPLEGDMTEMTEAEYFQSYKALVP